MSRAHVSPFVAPRRSPSRPARPTASLAWAVVRVLCGAALAAGLVPGVAVGQPAVGSTTAAATAPSDELALEDLMALEVQSVFGASKFLQKVTEAPASVTVVTAEDIRRFGYRSLADLLARVRGIYTASDRNYAYVGVRGFQRPGDYNTRVLLLVDGFRANDNVYDQAGVGDEFFVPMELIDRVEIVRGPSSSLYGSSAFFAIVNVVTKRASQVRPVETDLDLGSLDERNASVRAGHVFASGVELVAGATYGDRDGYDRLYFPEFDAQATNLGVAPDLDWQRRRGAYASLTSGGLFVQALYHERERGVPTGAWGAVFGDSRARLSDEYAQVNVAYETRVRGAQVRARGFFAHMNYEADLPFEADDGAVVMNHDVGVGRYWGSEVTVAGTWRRHHVTAGLELRDNFDQDQLNYDVDPYEVYLDDRRDSTTWAWYVQDEIRLGRHHLLNIGIRRDRYEQFDAPVMPRLAWIVTPDANTTVKVLFGTAFRAPNAYENWYEYWPYKANPGLQPERITTVEAVFERAVGRRVRVSANLFRYWVSDLITQQVDTDDLLVYENAGDVQATGVEFEAEGKWPGGVGARVSLAAQRADEVEHGATLDNAPARVAQAAFTFPVAGERVVGAVDVQAVGSRLSKSGRTVGGYVVPNLTVLAPRVLGHLDVSVSIHNLFDRRYADPAADELPVDVVTRDGRTVRVRCTWRF